MRKLHAEPGLFTRPCGSQSSLPTTGCRELSLLQGNRNKRLPTSAMGCWNQTPTTPQCRSTRNHGDETDADQPRWNRPLTTSRRSFPIPTCKRYSQSRLPDTPIADTTSHTLSSPPPPYRWVGSSFGGGKIKVSLHAPPMKNKKIRRAKSVLVREAGKATCNHPTTLEAVVTHCQMPEGVPYAL